MCKNCIDVFLESVKAASEIYSPLPGIVVEKVAFFKEFVGGGGGGGGGGVPFYETKQKRRAPRKKKRGRAHL